MTLGCGDAVVAPLLQASRMAAFRTNLGVWSRHLRVHTFHVGGRRHCGTSSTPGRHDDRGGSSSDTEYSREPEDRHGINPKTVAKRRKRCSVADLPTGPKHPHSTVLTSEEEAVILPLIENFIGESRSPFLAAMYLNFMEVALRAEQLPSIIGYVEKRLERFPDSNRFWIEMSFGGRIGSLVITIFHAAPESFGPPELRSRIDKILTQLIGLGIAQAHELEKLMHEHQ